MPHNVTAFRIILVLLLANIIACSDNLPLQENLLLDLTESSIGPITSQTPYELLEIVQLFPSFEVKEVTKYESNFPVTYITISSSSKTTYKHLSKQSVEQS